jgi:hypothetical protein
MLERAWQGGLRLIVALAVNSQTLAMISQTRGPYDDKSAATRRSPRSRRSWPDSFHRAGAVTLDVRQIIGSGLRQDVAAG